MDLLKDKIVWITGASRGIGAAIAEKLSQETSSKLMLSARSKDSYIYKTENLSLRPNTFILPCDIRKPNDITRIYNKINYAAGPVDILINNAGVGSFKPFTEISFDEFDEMNAVNYRGVFSTIKQCLPAMLNRQSGVIINIISGGALKAFKNSSVYSASKAAVLAMSKALREEVRQQGVKIIDILPGATETDIWEDGPRKKFREKMIQPEDVAQLVFHTLLQSQNPRYMVEEIIMKPQMGDL